MKNTVFTGAGVAIVTPMNSDGSINFDALGKSIDYQIENGTDAIIICGTTGESATMTDDEHIECIRYCVEKVNKRVPVVAGTGSNDTKYAVYDAYSRIDTVCLHAELQPSHPYLARDLMNFLKPPHYLGDDVVEAGKGIAKSIYSLFTKKNVPNRQDKEIRFKLYGSEYFCMGYSYSDDELIFIIRECNYKF